MGVILDTSVLISIERRGKSPSSSFAEIEQKFGDIQVGLSVLTILELNHGVERAQTELQRSRQAAFIDLLSDGLPVFPVSIEIARLAGRIEGALAAKGLAVALDDLLIGATALHLNFGVATLNAKHFTQIPNLAVTTL